MNIVDIEKLAKIMRASGLTSLEWSKGDETLRLAADGAAGKQAAAAAEIRRATAAETAAEILPEQTETEEDVSTLKAPMVGMLYLAPSPGAKPFVSVGDQVKKGDVVCIIEAMKLMNEITAEQDGEIVAVCAENGRVVEFGQPLFRLKQEG